MRRIDNATARRIFLDRHALLVPEGGPGKGDDLAALIDRLGFVQVDSVNTLARAHDLILWARRGQYRPRALERYVEDRQGFEHWTHDASVLPMAAWPHWRHRFARSRERLAERWEAWQRREFLHKVDEVRAHVAAHGPCGTDAVGTDETGGGGGWWDWKPSKTALEYLWHTGELAICHRQSFRKHYDLADRVIPDAVRAQVPTEAESRDWLMRGALDRLGFASSTELAQFWGAVGKPEARDWCAAAAERGEIVPVEVEGAAGTARVLWARPDLGTDLPAPGNRVRILSPFDPMLRDRSRAEWLFGFAYRIEIFVPEPKRRYGYYVFPVWQGDRAIGRIDMKADRRAGFLAVTAFWSEPGVRMGTGRTGALMAELDRLARFAGLDRTRLADGWLRQGDGAVGQTAS